MENDLLNNTWNKQDNLSIDNPETIISKAKNQRKRQIGAIVIMTITVVILVAYTLYIAPNKWNNFSMGLTLMISSLTFRILLEFGSIYRKESRLISMDNRSYEDYLKKHYKFRAMINYIITPICIMVYIYGFYLLLPYFKKEFSEGFYLYLVISGVVSLAGIIAIIINSIKKESRFLQKLKNN